MILYIAIAFILGLLIGAGLTIRLCRAVAAKAAREMGHE